MKEFASRSDEESCAGEALVEEESDLRICKLLEMSIFLWAQHPDGVYGVSAGGSTFAGKRSHPS